MLINLVPFSRRNVLSQRCVVAFTKMPSSFPTAKLLAIANVAAANGDCAKAIVSTARQLGLIGAESLSELSCPIEAQLCGSMVAAKRILHECLTEQGCQHLIEQLWHEVKEDLNEYKSQKRLDCDVCPSKLQCYGMVSTIIERILQKVSEA
jgi:hypothetical protein